MLRFVLAAGLVVLALGSHELARAEGRDPTTADVLFEEGRRAAEAGDWNVACAKFEASLRLDPAPGSLLNLGDCEEHRKNFARAWQNYRKLADTVPPTDERKALAERLAAAALARAPRLRVVAPVAPATITVDGTILGQGSTLPLEPGSHTVVVRAPRHKPRSYDVVVREGELRELTLALGEDEAPPVSDPPPTSAPAPVAAPPPLVPGVHHGPTVPTVVGWSLVGAGAASLLFATVFGGLALAQESKSAAACVGSVCESRAAVDAHERARTFALVTDVTLGLGVTLAATGVALVIVGKRGAAVQVGAAPMGLWVRGTF
jgi:hypothetical protein